VQLVILKMLPFDNKSEFQIIVDLPVGTPLEKTAQVLSEMGAAVAQMPEVTDYQAYAGTAAPINFNGLVRQYYLRAGPEVGDLQVNLVDKSERDRKSHDIAQAIRPRSRRSRKTRRRRQGGRSAARPAGDVADRRRNLRPRLRRADAGRQTGARRLRKTEASSPSTTRWRTTPSASCCACCRTRRRWSAWRRRTSSRR
jgi:multidrug efflux pump subunit AcrB